LFVVSALLGLILSLADSSLANDENKDRIPGEKIERSLPVHPQATVTLCVATGTLKVRGWDKSEVRVRSVGAEHVDFRRIDRVRDTSIPATRVDVMVLNKAAGMVVHPGSGNYTGTLLNGVAWYMQQTNPSINESVLPRYGLVHRIDKNTSGLLLMAKNSKAMTHLARQFYDHSVQRKYIALVWGDLKTDEGTIIAHVGRNLRFRKLFEAYPEGDHGKEAITHYKVLERFNYVTLVECVLETGRTHQIRVHMKYIGHPLFNDDTYGGDKIVKGTVFAKYRQFVDNCFTICTRQALHAKTLGFMHPTSKEKMFFETELPGDMQEVIEKWRNYTSGISNQ